MKNNNKIKIYIKVLILLVAFIGITGINSNHTEAAKDITRPTISLKQSTKEPTNAAVSVVITITDASGIYRTKWAGGSKSTSYFNQSGYTITLNSKHQATRTISKNGIYTFYAKDKAGNTSIKKLKVTNIDTTKPTIAYKRSTTDLTNKSVKLTLTLKDVGQGITSIKYLNGKKYTADFKDAGKDINFTETQKIVDTLNNNQYTYYSSLNVVSNRTVTLFLEDAAGNHTLKWVTVSNIDKDAPIATYSLSTKEPTNQPIRIKIATKDVGFGVKGAVYLAGKKTLDNFVQSNNAIPLSLSSYGNGYITANTNGYFSILVTDIVGNQTVLVVKISNIDTVLPTVQLNYTVMKQAATIKYEADDSGSGVNIVKYLKGKVTDSKDDRWTTNAKDISSATDFIVKSSGNYSVLVEDKAGNKAIEVITIELEFKAVWISYLEFLELGKGGFTQDSFEKAVDIMFNNVVAMNMNAVVVQVRPFGDAMYDSSYFPWSKYISGKQGVDPGFDPLEYMVEAAHNRGLEIQAWLNPYRVTTASTDYSALSVDNPARIWHEDNIESNDRNVLSYGGNLYYNPASKEVQNLIINGIKEIVNNYDIDGIHFDDYFYPSLGTSYKDKFDNIEYEAYAANCVVNNKEPLTIANWRRNNVNTLVKNVYKSIKSIDSSVQFGISPGGFYNTLLADSAYYTDIKTWLSSDGYIDYICPQIYWTFSNSSYPYAATLDKWLSYRTSSSVKVYVGIATYKAGSSLEYDWKNDDEELKKQVEYGRDTGLVDGYIFFRYNFFYNDVTEPGVNKLLEIL